MQTRYLCEPYNITANYVSMCLVKVFDYCFNCNYMVLELVIVLENNQKVLSRLNNIVKDSSSSNKNRVTRGNCQSYDVEVKASQH
jgi:hypothetical protein